MRRTDTHPYRTNTPLSRIRDEHAAHGRIRDAVASAMADADRWSADELAALATLHTESGYWAGKYEGWTA